MSTHNNIQSITPLPTAMVEQEVIPLEPQSPPASASISDSETATEDGKISTARLLRRVDIRLVPILSALYLLCFLCRQNIGNAKSYHMSADLPLTTQEYQLALTAFFLAYSTFDIPCNILLKKLRPSVWLPLITFLSGVVTTCMGVVKNADELIVVRLILGMTEVSSSPIAIPQIEYVLTEFKQCGLFPGVAYVITMWYCKKEAQFRQALFFCAARYWSSIGIFCDLCINVSSSMAGAFAGLLAVGLSKMDGLGNYEGWRWILIIEGLLTVLVALLAFFLVLDYPATCSFLTDSEKAFLLRRLEVDEFGEEEESLSKEEKEKIHAEIPKRIIFAAVFRDWHIYAHIFVFWGISCPLYSISLCLPSIVQELGYTNTQANLLTIPIYLTACLFSLFTAYFSDRTGKRALFIAVSYGVMFVGFLIAAVRPASVPGLAYAGVFIAACGIYPAFPGMITWASNNLASSGKRGIGMALHIGMGSFGGAMGANFYRTRDAPGFRLGHCLNLMFVGLGACAIAGLYWSYWRENKAREERCVEMLAELERSVEGKKEEVEADMRRAFLERKEESLASDGDGSVWFRYTL